MNILVTGAAGFIGANLVEHLVAAGQEVYGLVHDIRPGPTTGWTPLVGDILDTRRMLEIIVDREIDFIYHLAAKSIVRNCRLDPAGCFMVNVQGTVSILEAARQSGRIQGILAAESDKSYGAGPVPYREGQALQPTAVYEASKACVSHACAAYHNNYGLPVLTVRGANVYGERDPNRSRLVPNTILRLLAGQAPQIISGASDFKREFIYVGDVCQVYTRLMASGRWGEAFNVGSGECRTVREVVDLICRAMGREDVRPEEWERPATLVEIPQQFLCLDKLLDVWPEFRPRAMLLVLPKIIDWYTKHQGRAVAA